jgi:hypothetical protein
MAFERGQPVRFAVSVNGQRAGESVLDRAGLFIFEADIPDAPEYLVEIHASPVWTAPGDDRQFTVNLGMLRLVPRD